MIEQINKSNDETENKTELKIIKNLTLEFKPNPNIRTTFILLIFFCMAACIVVIIPILIKIKN